MKIVTLMKDIQTETLRILIMASIKGVKESELPDERIEAYKQTFGDYTTMMGMKAITQELRPRKVYDKEDMGITAIYIVTMDEGYKDNIVYHLFVLDHKLIRIKDRGMGNFEFGGVYNLECVASIDSEDSSNVFYELKKDKTPEQLQVLSKEATLDQLHKISKHISELEHGEMAVVSLEISHKISKIPWMKDDPMYISDKKKGVGLNFKISGFLPPEEERGKSSWLSLLFFPQRYGKQFWLDIFPEDFFTRTVPHAKDDLSEELMSWILPSPSDLKLLAIGRVRVQSEGDYAGSKSLQPCISLIMDERQLEERFSDLIAQQVAAIESGEIAPDERDEPEDPEPEPEAVMGDDEGDLTEADDSLLAMYLEYNDSPTLTAEYFNTLLGKKGHYTTDFDLNRVRKDKGYPVAEKPKPKKKKSMKKRSKTKRKR